MNTEVHGSFRELMDRSLVAGVTPEEERSLREHVAECAACGEYMEASRRAIAGLKGFSFEAGPELNAKVMQAVRRQERMRAQEAEARGEKVARWVRLSLIALVLTVVGSVVDLWLGHWAATALGLRASEVRASVMALWIVPSIGLLLLFPLLPLLMGDGYRRGRAL